MPDAPPINLIQLREQIAAQASELEVDYYPIEHDALLALIDTAEAAQAIIAFCNQSGLLVGRREYVRLAETLARYTTQ